MNVGINHQICHSDIYGKLSSWSASVFDKLGMKWNMFCLLAVCTGVPVSNTLDVNITKLSHVKRDVFPPVILFVTNYVEALHPY